MKLMLSVFTATGLLLAAPAVAGPVVVELYQSQGCSSCPPAIANVNALAARDDVLPLMFAVTYWDRLGWKDVFAQPAFTARQWDYAKGLGNANVWTPQVVVNGTATVIGSRKPELDSLIAKAAARQSAGPVVTISGSTVSVAAGTGAKAADVWLVHYDPRTLTVAIKAGENGGRTLPHRNVVTGLTRIGRWTGTPLTLEVRATPEGQRAAVLLQNGVGGAIIAAARD